MEGEAPSGAAAVPHRSSRWERAAAGRRLTASLLTLAGVACVFRILIDPLQYRDLISDESFFVWGGWCITKGLVPYRDFMDYKPPLVFLTHAMALAAGGFEGFRYRWFFVWFPLASVTGLSAALLSRGTSRILVLALALAITGIWVDTAFHESGFSDAESIGLSYYFGGVACLIARVRWVRASRIAAGALLICSVLSKEPFLATVAPTGVACFFLDAPRPWRTEAAVAYLRWTGAGATLVLAALAIYLGPTGGLGAYLAMTARYGRLFNDPIHGYCALIGRFHHTTMLGDIASQLRGAHARFLNLRVLGPIGPFALIFGWAALARRHAPALTAAVLGALVGSFAALTATHCQWKHDFVMTMSGIFFIAVLGAIALAVAVPSARARRLIGCSLLAFVSLLMAPRVAREARLFGSRRAADPYQEPIPGVRAAVATFTVAADRIVTTGAPALYVQAERRSALREAFLIDEALGFYDGDSDKAKLSDLRTELEVNRPKLVVIDPLWASRQERYRRALFLPFLETHAYREVAPDIWVRPP